MTSAVFSPPNPLGLRPQIVKIDPGSGADQAFGISLGDVLLSVDGSSLSGKSAEEAYEMLNGAKGSIVTLSVKESRRGSQPKSVQIARL